MAYGGLFSAVRTRILLIFKIFSLIKIIILLELLILNPGDELVLKPTYQVVKLKSSNRTLRGAYGELFEAYGILFSAVSRSSIPSGVLFRSNQRSSLS